MLDAYLLDTSFGRLKFQIPDMKGTGSLDRNLTLVPSTPLNPSTPINLSLSSQAEPQLGFPQGISSQAESTPSVWLGLNNTTPDIQRATKL
ncbi:unnamed protein product [Rhizophagus irregularis]|nr:unnamed protein product [Rhizophagus irregularis]